MPLDRYLATLRHRHGPVPGFDPLGAGTDARLLILLETPGRGMDSSTVVTLDAPTGTARNLSRWLAESCIARESVLLWNVVPWLIHAEDARTQAPRRGEAESGMAELPGLPALRAVVLAGRAAARAGETVRACTGAPTFGMAHPSPVYINTDPAIAVRCRETLREAARVVNGDA